MKVKVTVHALQRFRERIDPKADLARVEALVRAAQPAPKWMYRFACKGLVMGQLLVNGIAFFTVVVKDGETRVVITTLTVPFVERLRLKFSKKANKIRRKQCFKNGRSHQPMKEAGRGGTVHERGAGGGEGRWAEVGDTRRRRS